MKSPTDASLDSLVSALDAAESAVKVLRKHSDRLCESSDADDHLPPDALMSAYVASLDLVEAARHAGKHLRRLEQLEVPEPCS